MGYGSGRHRLARRLGSFGPLCPRCGFEEEGDSACEAVIRSPTVPLLPKGNKDIRLRPITLLSRRKRLGRDRGGCKGKGRGGADEVDEGFADFGEVVAEAGGFKLAGERLLAFEEQGGVGGSEQIRELEHKGGGGRRPWAADDRAERGHEEAIVARLGGGEVDGALDAVFEAVDDRADKVIDVNPTDELIAGTVMAAEEPLGEVVKGGEHASVAAKDDAGAEFDAAHLGEIELIDHGFPGDAGVHQEVLAGSGVGGFCEFLGSPISIDADGGAVEPGARTMLDAFDGLADRAGALDSGA